MLLVFTRDQSWCESGEHGGVSTESGFVITKVRAKWSAQISSSHFYCKL